MQLNMHSGRVGASAGAARPALSVRPGPVLATGIRPIAATRPSYVPQAAAGGGDGGAGAGGKKPTGGSGNGGSGSSGSGKGQGGEEPKDPKQGGIFKGWADRVAFDPEFPIKVLMEQVIGVGACVIGDMSARPNWGLNELDFIFSTLIVGSIMNFSIMYLLAPTAGVAAGGMASMGLVEKILSGAMLSSWGAPGGNMFEAGKYSAGKRLLNFGYKGCVFACIGFLAGIFGTATSNTLLAVRKQLDPNFTIQNEPPNIIWNACTWGIHMGLSSNFRYQTLGGIDAVLVKAMPLPAFRIYQAVIRGANNIVGGMSFVMLARLMGTQKAAA